jgi:hypothetical protein
MRQRGTSSCAALDSSPTLRKFRVPKFDFVFFARQLVDRTQSQDNLGLHRRDTNANAFEIAVVAAIKTAEFLPAKHFGNRFTVQARSQRGRRARCDPSVPPIAFRRSDIPFHQHHIPRGTTRTTASFCQQGRQLRLFRLSSCKGPSTIEGRGWQPRTEGSARSQRGWIFR